MYLASIITYIFLIIFSGLCYFWIIPTYSPADLGYGIPATFFPSVLVISMAILSAVKLVFTVITKEGKDIDFGFTLPMLFKFIIYACCFLASMLMFEYLGYFLSAFILITVFQLLCSERKVVKICLVSASATVVMYVIFWHGLNILLPQGRLFLWT